MAGRIEAIRLRPHHCACLLLFEGKGYSKGFVKGMFEIKKALEGDAAAEIELVSGADSVCGGCPNLKDGCAASEKTLKLDEGWARALGFEDARRVSWKEAKERSAAALEDGALFEKICAPCQWFSLCREIKSRLFDK